MVNGDDIHRTSHTPKEQRVRNSLLRFKGCKDQTSPTFQQLLQRDGSKWSRISSQIKKKEDKENWSSKKSVLAKVKEHVKKLKISLRRKKHSDTRCPATSSSYVGQKDRGEEDVEYHSARMQAPSTNKDKHASPTNVTTKAQSDSTAIDTENQTATSDALDELCHESPQPNSRFKAVSSTSDNKSDTSVKDHEKVNMKWDKGVVTVKDFLIHKFKPGEDEHALSKVITETITPKRDKMRETLSLFIKNQELLDQVGSSTTSNVDNDVDLNIKSKSLPTSTNNIGSTITPIKQISYSLGSNASLNLNQSFKSAFASYQDRFLGSSSNHNMILNHDPPTSSNTNLTHLKSPTKTSSSNAPSANNETTQASSQGLDSSAKKIRIPATSVRRVHVSRSNQKRVPIHTETNIVNSISCI